MGGQNLPPAVRTPSPSFPRAENIWGIAAQTRLPPHLDLGLLSALAHHGMRPGYQSPELSSGKGRSSVHWPNLQKCLSIKKDPNHL